MLWVAVLGVFLATSVEAQTTAAKCMDLYGVLDEKFYKKSPPQYASDDWIGSATKVGTANWSQFTHLFFHPDGILYGVFNNTFYKRSPPAYPSDNWIGSAQVIGTSGWNNFKHLFFHNDGTLYGVWNDKFYKGSPPAGINGDGWIESATLIGTSGWGSSKFLFFDPSGTLYGVFNDQLHKRAPPTYGEDGWLRSATRVGPPGWSGFRHLFFMADGHMFGVEHDQFYRRTPPVAANDNWMDTAKKIGTAEWSAFKFLISRPGNATAWPPVVIGAVWPPGRNEVFAQGSREYQFFRAALRWLESERKVAAGTLSKFLREAARTPNGMIDWRNVFDFVGPEGHSYTLALNRVLHSLRDYAYSGEEVESEACFIPPDAGGGRFVCARENNRPAPASTYLYSRGQLNWPEKGGGERRMYQTLSQMARRIANNRGEVSVSKEWEQFADFMEREASAGAEAFGGTVKAAAAPTAEAVEAGVGFSEAAEAAAVGAEVANGAVAAKEITEIAAIILLL